MKPTGKPTAERANKKAEVIGMIQRAKDATLLCHCVNTGKLPSVHFHDAFKKRTAVHRTRGVMT